MKTKFIKKLSFVLVVAMVLSLFVPAAGAFAASAPKLNSTKKYLHLGRADSGENEFNFNIKNKKSGWKYFWESANEAVAEVNEKNGVTTATGVGKTKVTVTITDKDGEEVDTLSATVTVRDNIKEVTIANPVEKLGVNEEHDYNRNFKTESGSTKKTDSITRWTVEPAETATINDKGVFVATAAGEYTVTARSFQSKARYNAWVDDAEANAAYVLDSDETKVKVSASMVSVDQLSLNKVNAVFDSAMTEVKENIRLYRVIGSTRVLQSLKDVKMDADNKIATLEAYVNFVEGDTYVIEYEGLEGLSFVAAKVESDAVTRMEILTKTAMTGRSTMIDVALYNADGVNIANDVLKSRVTIESSNEQTWAEGRALTMYNVGDTTTITATYNTYNYDDKGNQLGVVTATGVVTCVEYAETNVTGISAYTISDEGADFVNVNHTIAALDEGYYLYVKFDAKDINGSSITVYSDTKGENGFTFDSSNNNVLIMDPFGYISPVAPGSVTVIVKHNDTVVGTVPITVSSRRVLGSVSLDTYKFTLSNSPFVQDTKTVTLTVKDQLGRNMDPKNYEVTSWKTSQTGDMESEVVEGTPGSIWNNAKISFDAEGKKIGTYAYAVKVTDNNVNTSMTLHITVEVKEPKTDKPVSYRIETDKTYDMAIHKDDKTEDVTISVFGYDSNGVRNQRVDLASDAAVKIEITHNGKDVPFEYDDKAALVRLVDTDAVKGLTGDDAKITKMKTGTYSIKFFVQNEKGEFDRMHSAIFTVKDTQMKPTVSVKKAYAEVGTGNVLAGINECFAFSFNGYPIDEADIYDEKYTGSTRTGQIFVKSVKYKQIIDGNAYVEHTIDINRTIQLADK